MKKNFLAAFPFFTSKWKYCRVTGPQNKIFIKNQLTLMRSIGLLNLPPPLPIPSPYT
jgi:hypothetical protein